MSILDDCWEWNGWRTADGYGQRIRHGRRQRLHRVAYEWANGPIPSGLFVLHSCDNPPCVNPRHLRVGTNQENIRESVEKGRHINAGKTHCPKGHEYAGRNLILDKTRQGVRRRCRVCRNELVAAMARRKRAAIGLGDSCPNSLTSERDVP